jgi:hypothetical protein
MKALPLAKAVAGYLPRQKGAEGLLTPSQRANLGRHSWRHPEISNVFRECHQRTDKCRRRPRCLMRGCDRSLAHVSSAMRRRWARRSDIHEEASVDVTQRQTHHREKVHFGMAARSSSKSAGAIP